MSEWHLEEIFNREISCYRNHQRMIDINCHKIVRYDGLIVCGSFGNCNGRFQFVRCDGRIDIKHNPILIKESHFLEACRRKTSQSWQFST